MHIRRTDHSELAKLNNLYTTYEEFDKFISDCKEKKIFLATDSLDVQKKYTSCLYDNPWKAAFYYVKKPMWKTF